MSLVHEHVEIDCGDGTSMDAYVSRPAEGGRRAGVLVFQEIWGVNAHVRDVVDRLARLGYAVAAPDLFHRTAPKFDAPYAEMTGVPHAQAMTREGVRADVVATHRWLTTQLGDGAPIAAVGFCMGGRIAFTANGILPLAGAVSFYGGGIAQTALDVVPTQSGPVLFLWAGKDKHILPEHRRATIDAMHAAQKPFVHVLFSNSDHGFFCDQRGAFDKEAAHHAWALATSFLAARLG